MSDRPDKFTNGFTLVEVLIVLAITALLLAAVAVCFNSAVMNYQQNEDIFKTVNNARQALSRITTQVRTGHSFKLDDPNNKCSFFTSADEDITYDYRSADGKLYLITNSDGHEYVLCENVVFMNFIKTLADNGLDFKSMQVSMTVKNGDVQQTLSAAAVIRRNL